MLELAGPNALVTGASRGIGAAIARTLAQAGAYVVGTATTESGARHIGEVFADGGLAGTGVVLDVTDDASVGALFERLGGEARPPSIVVNNAGITRDGLLMRMRDEDWNQVIDTNLNGLYRICKACVRPMVKARSGRIINITSVVGLSGNPGQSNYAAAKAGVVGFTRALAREIGGRGVTVNAVAPGFIDTDMTRVLDESLRRSLVEQIPLGRLGSADDVAAAVLYLASAQAAYVTGEVLNVSGGLYMS